MLNRKYIRIIEIILAIFILSIILYYAFNSQTLSYSKLEEILDSEKTFLNYIIYSISFLILTLIGFSVAPLVILSSIYFSLLDSIILNSILLCISSTIAFLIGRKFKEKIPHTNHHSNKFKLIMHKIENIEKKLDEHPVRNLFISRFFLSNIPISYAVGFETTIKIREFLIATVPSNVLIVMILSLFGYVAMKNISYLIILLIIVAVLYYLFKHKLHRHTL